MSKNNQAAGNSKLSLGGILISNVLILIVIWLVLLIPLNNVFVTLLKNFSSCPPSTFQTLGAALILLVVAHLIWRNFRGPLEKLVEGADSLTIKVGQFLLDMFPYLQPIELNDRGLGASLGVALVIASALIWLSPSRHGVPILLSGFTVQHTTSSSTEAIHPGDTLLVAPGEIVRVSASVEGPEGSTCKWYTNIGTKLGTDRCSLTYSAPRSANWDNVAVLVSSPCRTDPGVFAGFHIRAARTTP